MVSYPHKESVVCYPCFTRQQAKNTGNRFAVNSSMNGIQMKKYLWANAESPITVPLYRIRKNLDSLICTKYQNSIVVLMMILISISDATNLCLLGAAYCLLGLHTAYCLLPTPSCCGVASAQTYSNHHPTDKILDCSLCFFSLIFCLGVSFALQ